MEFVKVCLECGKQFEDKKLNDTTILCPECGCGDIEQVNEASYNEITLENCFELYHENKVACVCNADEKKVIFKEE